MMTVTEAALRTHDSELRIACYYLRIVDDATRVQMAEGLARRWANEMADKSARPKLPQYASVESPGSDQ